MQLHLQVLIVFSDKSLTKPNCCCLVVAEGARPRRIAVEGQVVVSILEVLEAEASTLVMLMQLACWLLLHHQYCSLMQILLVVTTKLMIGQSLLLQKMMNWQAGLH